MNANVASATGERSRELPSEADLDELRALARSIFERYAAETLYVQRTATPFDGSLWQTLAASGLTLLSTPESAGGSGAGIAEAAVVLAAGAEHAAAVPIAETDLLAAWLLVLTDLDVPAGPLTSGAGEVSIAEGPAGSLVVSGTLERVPWARSAEAVVVLGSAGGGDVVFVVPAGRCSITAGHNLAHEPRDCVRFKIELSSDLVLTVGEAVGAEWVLRGALARAAQTCGALEKALELTVDHASSRIQFGRPLGRFQAVQHLIAEAAGEVTTARAALDVAIRTVAQRGFANPSAELAVAVAKAHAAGAAGVVSRAAHQVHGAIGFTLDHQLRHFTLRALAWRNEFGDARSWERRIGQIALETGAEGLWNLVTSGDGESRRSDPGRVDPAPPI
jgi:acyl-CoA dehydrogenase